MALLKQRHHLDDGENQERPNPRVPSKLMDRVRARAAREKKSVNLMLVELLSLGLKEKA